MKVKFTLGIGFVGADREKVFDYGDEFEGWSQEEINEALESDWQDWSSNYIEGSWDVLDDC